MPYPLMVLHDVEKTYWTVDGSSLLKLCSSRPWIRYRGFGVDAVLPVGIFDFSVRAVVPAISGSTLTVYILFNAPLCGFILGSFSHDIRLAPPRLVCSALRGERYPHLLQF